MARKRNKKIKAPSITCTVMGRRKRETQIFATNTIGDDDETWNNFQIFILLLFFVLLSSPLFLCFFAFHGITKSTLA
jgi:hypothetical protein